MNLPRLLRTLSRLTLRQLGTRLRHEWWMRRRQRIGWPALDAEVKFNKTRLAPPPPEDLARLKAQAGQWQRGVVEYLGLPGTPGDWRAWHRPRLWRYERHYHAELVALAAMALEDPPGPWVEAARELVDSWAADALPEQGDAWEPYPTARRILNWCEAAALEPRLAGPLPQRLMVQVRHLLKHLEHHLRGNHLLCDAAALVAAGSVLQGTGAPEAMLAGTLLLEKELGRQVLPDGGYAERTVLYHSLVLRDSLLAMQLARERGQPPSIKAELSRMATWLVKVRRPDGSYPCVNDSTPQAAPIAEDAVRRAVRMNLLGALPAGGPVVELPETGWTFLREGGCELFFDHGPLGPKEQPGHGHADALAYELYWYNLPVVTDSGATTYELGPIRDFERSAAAHATVSVDGEGVDELWASFRAGGRGEVEKLEPPAVDARLRALRGRARSFRGWTHDRWLFFWPGRALLVIDRVSGAKAGAALATHIPLDPAWSAAESNRVHYLLGPGARGLQLHLLRGESEGIARGQENPRDGWVGQGFGKSVPRSSLRIRADAQGIAAYAFFAPGVAIRTSEAGLHLRAPGAEVALKLVEGLPA